MRIFIEGSIFQLQRLGGVSEYITNLASGLKKKGEDVEIVLSGPNKQGRKIPGIKTTDLYFPGEGLLSLIKKSGEFVRDQFWMKTDTGIVHASYFEVPEKVRVPIIVTVYDLVYEKFPEMYELPNERALAKKMKVSIENADGVICISEAVRRDVLKTYKVDAKKVWTTRLGVSDFYKKISRNKALSLLSNYDLHNRFILYVGKRGKHKNFEVLIKAMSKRTNNLQLICAGGGEFSKDEGKMMRNLGVRKKVILLPHPSDDELLALYNLADALIVTSLDEGFGLTLLEAMMCRCPVVASDIKVFREVAKGVPYYFDPTKPRSLLQRIEQRLSDRLVKN